jgi:chromate reductase, NAD(P)H dehydrogenase (quinone)
VADVRILLISGSTRQGSGNTAALRTAQAVAPDGLAAEMYDGLTALPAFSPDEDERPPGPAADLRARIAAAGALLFCTPEYAGTLPGSLKNLLDWTVGGTQLSGRPVGWINVAAAGRGGGATRTLETVLGYVGADIVAAACLSVPIAREALDEAGRVVDPAVLGRIAEIWTAISTHRVEPIAYR